MGFYGKNGILGRLWASNLLVFQPFSLCPASQALLSPTKPNFHASFSKHGFVVLVNIRLVSQVGVLVSKFQK